jgi:hypothetical protein
VKNGVLLVILILRCLGLSAGSVEKIYTFGTWSVDTNGEYRSIRFENTRLSAVPGDPALPWQQVVLMLPPGESAVSIEISGEEETPVPGSWNLFPQQEVRPLSQDSGSIFLRNEKTYHQQTLYPAQSSGHLMTQYLDGYGFAICTFTPVRYIPASGAVSYYKKVIVRILTQPDPQAASSLRFLTRHSENLERIRAFTANPEMMQSYTTTQQSGPEGYDYLIICPPQFKNEFQSLISMEASKGLIAQVATTDSISSTMSGYDLQEKIRNFIIEARDEYGISYVLLAGNPPLVPSRGFFCSVLSGGSYITDSLIPTDLYYAGLDGNYDANMNHVFGEVDDEPDLLPEISVGRFPVNDTAELRRMIRKTIAYQTNPVLGEMKKPFLVGEYLYPNPMTFGSSYLNLLINDHGDYGYFTHGISSATNTVVKLNDSLVTFPSKIWYWNTYTLLLRINAGTSFIHHLGHCNQFYMLKLSKSDITDANFYAVNGVDHNYALLYSQGCYGGAFDDPGGCIAAKAVTINNFCVAGVFNSRYGWFDEGTSDGPSEHLQREFVSALYTDTLPEFHIGTAHNISKTKTAPWISLPGEFEPGAQRWVHYDCNIFGDPALTIWVDEPTLFSQTEWTGAIDSDWLNAGNWSPPAVPTSLNNVTVDDSSHPPVITTVKRAVCHDLTIKNGASVTIQSGKSLIVRGSVVIEGN